MHVLCAHLRLQKNPLEERQISNTWQQTLANNNVFKKQYEQSEFRKCLLPFCPESYALLFIFQTHRLKYTEV
jgi:hypothetical protein